MAASLEPCERLEWDTAFFGFPIARVGSETLTPDLADAINTWCAQQGIHCLYFLGRPDDVQTTHLAEDRGFRLMDLRLTFECKMGSAIAEAGSENKAATRIRHATVQDIEILKSIARNSHHDTRFYFDDKFPRHLCDSLYETWIKLSCEGYADAVLVSELDGIPAGYISCHINKETGAGKIGLVGVAVQARGRGVGNALVRRSLEWFRAAGVIKVSVVTQGRNIAAQRLYQRYGFVTESVHVWYHKWFV